jgi:hypothetical protein
MRQLAKHVIRGAGPLFCGLIMLLGAPVTAQERVTLGVGRVLSNDYLADQEDRWRTGSYGFSVIRGSEWTGDMPARFGEVMEYRFRGEIIAPSDVSDPATGDRLYAGVLSGGVHTHAQLGGFEFAVGADLVIVGEQTGLRKFHEALHDLTNFADLDVEDYQIEDGIYVSGVFEAARVLSFGSADLRPFVELQAGVETFARAGFDLTLGGYGDGGLRVRDPITGHRISAINSLTDQGVSFLLGADVAFVDSSIFLPEERGFEVEENRHRIRAGVNYAFGSSNIYYGLTYLSEEFVGQPEGQVIGTLSFDLRF